MEKVAENEKTIFYKNDFCIEKKGYKMLVAELKDTGEKEYIIVNKGNILYGSKRAEDVWNRIDIYASGIIKRR